MNTLRRTFALIAVVTFTGFAVPRSNAEVGISVDYFYDNLDPYGEWVEVGDYGYCWHPRDVAAEWRPYSDGRWVHTGAGWTWASDEPYGWAVYHYGRWAHTRRLGWVWIPGTEWGPAWVSWRHGDRYVGWAPLPPEARFNARIGFGSSVDVSFDIGPIFYSFVELRNIGAPRLREVIVEPQQNITIINQTTNITNITTVNNTVVNQGPNYAAMSRASSQPIPQLELVRTATGGALGTKVEGSSLKVAAPAMTAGTPNAKPKKVAAKIEKSEVSNGWKGAGSAEEVEKLRTKMKAEPKAVVAAPGKEPAPVGKPDPKPGQPIAPTIEKPAVKGQPPPVPNKGKPGKPGKPEPVVPTEKKPATPPETTKPHPPGKENPTAPVTPPEKSPKPKRPNAENPPAKPTGPGEPPHDPKPKGKEAEAPKKGAAPEQPQPTKKAEPKPEPPRVIPPRPGPPDGVPAKPKSEDKDKKGKEKPAPDQ